MRRILSFLLSIVMVFSMLPVGAFAAQTADAAAPTEQTVQTEETTVPAAEEPAETAPEATAPAETICTEGSYVPAVSLADSEELLEGWLGKLFYGEGSASVYGSAAGNQLNSSAKVLYKGLKEAIAEIAAGVRTSTVITANVYDAKAAAIDAFCVDQVLDALLHDCPYELYWYAKTEATSYSWSFSGGYIYSVTFTMPVAADLQGSGYTDVAPVVDVTLATEAAAALATAQQIVSDNKGKSTYEKLVNYRDAICGLASYNDAAASGGDFALDADPWQLLWVFDGDDSTTVVCEGYSKAFQYLCDEDGGIDCYTVSGTMASSSGSGGHMWNIVTLYDANYLVDVTNSDEDTAGYNGTLFLNGCTGSVANGYTFKTAGGNIKFVYDTAVKELWGTDGILVLSTTAFDPDSVPEETEPAETEPVETEPVETEPEQSSPQTEFLADLEEAIANGSDSYFLESALTLTDDLTIDHNIWIYLCDGSITVPEGYTLTIGSNTHIAVIDGGSLNIMGTLNAAEDLDLNITRGSLTVSDSAVWNVPDQSVDIDLFTSVVSAPAAVLATLYAHANAATAEEVKTALEKEDAYSRLRVGVYETMDLDWDVTIPGNTQLDIYNGGDSGTVTVTVPAGCTLTNNGLITVGEGCLLLVEENASLVNNQSFEYSEGTYINNGTEVRNGIIHGVYGSNVSWSYDPDTTTLTISGTGAMMDKSDDVPWSDYQLYATKLVIEEGITGIGNAVFERHSALESVTLPDSVTAIGDEAFLANASLQELKLGENLQTIGSNAFESCFFLSSVILPEYVATVGSYAFYNCTNLAEFRFPSSITAIGDYAMGGCEALETVTFVGMPPSIGDNSFAGVVATVSYPANAGWMDINLQNYGGTLTWVSEEPVPEETEPVEDPTVPTEPEIVGGMTQDQFLEKVNAAAAAGETCYVTAGITLTGDMVLDQSVRIILHNGGSLTVPEGCTLTLGSEIMLGVEDGGSLNVNGTLASDASMVIQVVGGALTGSAASIWNVPEASIFLTLDNVTLSIPDSTKIALYATKSVYTLEELKAIVADSGLYGFVNAGVYDNIALDTSLTIPGNMQIGIGTGGMDITLEVPEGCTLTNNGWIGVDEYGLLYIAPGGILVNNQSLEYWENAYLNEGTEINNGHIHENRIVDSVPELNEELAEAAAAAGDDNFPTVYLNENLTLVSGETVSIPANVTLIVNALLTMESGSVVTIQAGGCLMSGLYESDVLNIKSGAQLHNYGQLQLRNGNCVFAADTYIGYEGSVVELYPTASVTGIPESIIDCKLYFGDETGFAQALAAAQTGTYNSYTLRTDDGCGIVAIAGTYEIPSNTTLELSNGSGLELLTGADVTNNGVINLLFGPTLIIAQDALLTNNNVIYNYGGIIDGVITGNQPMGAGSSGGPGTSGGSTAITDQAALEQALQTVFGSIILENPITLTSDLNIDAVGMVWIQNGGSLVVPAGKTLVINSRVLLSGGSILVEDGGALIVTRNGKLENDSGTITNMGTVYIEAAGDGIWEYPANGATSSGIDKSLMKGVVYVNDTESVLKGVDAAAMGYGEVAIVASCGFTLTESVTIPKNATLELIWFDVPVTVTIPDTVTLTNEGTLLVLADTELIVEQGGRLINNGHMEVHGTYNNNGTHSGTDPVRTNDGSGIQSGACGENLTWRFEEATGTLTISGSGDMDSFPGSFVVDPGMKPWRHLTWKITRVIIEEGAASIEEYAFSDYPMLQTVILPESLKTIGANAFCWNSALEEITIPSGVESIGSMAFRGCSSLQKITFAGGLPAVEIADTAFYGVTASVYYPSADRTWDRGCGQYGGDLTWIPYGPNDGTCGENLTWVFDELSGTLTISGTGEMGDYYDDTVADETFAPWRHLRDQIIHVVIGEGITKVTDYVIYDYPNLETILLPESLNIIDVAAFGWNVKLKEIRIPSQVTTVERFAFGGCEGLEKITFTGNAPVIADLAFTGVTATAYYPGANTTWTADKLQSYSGNLTWKPLYNVDQSGLNSVIDSAPLNGDGDPYILQDITLEADATLCREDVTVVFSADSSLTIPAGVTLTVQSDVIFSGRLTVEEGGALVMENHIDQTDFDDTEAFWVNIYDYSGAEIDGTLTLGSRCSYMVYGDVAVEVGKTGVVNNYGTLDSEPTGSILVEGVLNNYSFLAVFEEVSVPGVLNNFNYIRVDKYVRVDEMGTGKLVVDGRLVNEGQIELFSGASLSIPGNIINHGEVGINAGSSVYVKGRLSNTGVFNHFKAEDESVTGYFVVDGTLVNEQSGEMYLRDWVVVRNTVENYGFLHTSSMFHVESGVVKNLNQSVDSRGYLITESTSEFIVQGKLENSGDIEHFGYMEMDGGTADIGGSFYNHGTVGLGHFYGGTMNLTGTFNNEGEIWVNHSNVNGQLLDGILNIDGELINNGMLGISGEANLTGALTNRSIVRVEGETAVMTIADGAHLTNESILAVENNGRLTAAETADLNLAVRIDLGLRGIVEGISDSNMDLNAIADTEEDLYYVLTEQAAKHAYANEDIRVCSSITFDGVECADGTTAMELTVPLGTNLQLMPVNGQVVFAAGTALVNQDTIYIGGDSYLIIEENARLENNGRIDAYQGWLQVNGEQTGQGSVEVPETAWVSTEAQLQAAVAMGTKTIYVQSAASYAARTVSTLTLTKNLTIPRSTRVILQGVWLTVPETVTLCVNGQLVITDEAAVTVAGTLENNADLRLESGSLTFSETGTYEKAPDAQVVVTSGFTVTEDVIPADSVISNDRIWDAQQLQELLAALEEQGRYRMEVTGDFSLETDITVPANVELILSEGVTLSVPEGVRLYNRGTITVEDNARLQILGQHSYVEQDGVLNIAEYGSFTTEYPRAESILLQGAGHPGYVTLQRGETADIAAVLLPQSAAGQQLLWSVEQEENVISLDTDALRITALAEGTAVIRARTTDGSGLNADLNVTVTGYGLQIAAAESRLLAGQSLKLTAQWIPGNYTGSDIIWSLENGGEAYAKLKAKGDTATITAGDVTEVQTITVLAQAADGEAAPARYRLTLIPRVKAVTVYNCDPEFGWEGEMSDAYAHAYVLRGEWKEGFDLILRAEAIPQGSSSAVSWSSDNTAVAYFVEDPDLEAGYMKLRFTKNPGTARITAAATDGSKTAKTITFKTIKPVEPEAVGSTELELTAGKSLSLKLRNAETGKEIRSSDIHWYICDAFDELGNWTGTYNSVIDAKGKLNTKKVTSREHIIICGEVTAEECYMGEVYFDVTVYPKTTAVELYQGNDLVNGKTLALDVSSGAASLKLSALQLPLGAKPAVSWKSSNAAVATVEDGIVTFAGKTGTVTITATAADSGKKATVKVEVGEMTTMVTGIAPEVTLVSGRSMTLQHTTVPAAPTKTGVTWAILEGGEYAKLSGNKLTAKTVTVPRTVVLAATSKDAAGVVSEPVTVTILPKAAQNLNLLIGDEVVTGMTRNVQVGDTFQLAAWMFPNSLETDARLTDVTWTAKNSGNGVAEISTPEGTFSKTTTVTIVGTGSTVITATGNTADGKKVTASVTVKSGVLSEGVRVTSDVFTVGSGKSITLKAETIPAKPATGGVVWSLAPGDEAYAKISSSGKLTAVKGLNSAQEITVLVQARDGASEPLEIPVTITPLATAVDLFLYGSYRVTGRTESWPVNQEMRLTARVYPFHGFGENGGRSANQSVTWKSSNNAIVSIDPRTGEVTFGEKTGSVTITATANDGSGKKATFKVKTVMPVTELEISDGFIAGGKTLKLDTLTKHINADATSKKLSYYIVEGDGEAYVTLKNGQLKTQKVTAQKCVKIRAMDEYGFAMEEFWVYILPATTRINLEVLVDGTFVTVNGKTLELEAGRLLSVQGCCDPDGAHDNYTWKITNPGYACLRDEVGEEELSTFEGCYALVEGLTPGKTVTLTATAMDGTGKKATVKIKIVEARPE